MHKRNSCITGFMKNLQIDATEEIFVNLESNSAKKIKKRVGNDKAVKNLLSQREDCLCKPSNMFFNPMEMIGGNW